MADIIPPYCRAVLVESIPEGLDYPNASTSNPSTSQAWLGLLAGAHSSLDIASFYWTLANNDTHTQESSAQQVPGNLDPERQGGSGRHGDGGERGFSSVQETGRHVSHCRLDTGVWKQLFTRPSEVGTFVPVHCRPLNVKCGFSYEGSGWQMPLTHQLPWTCHTKKWKECSERQPSL